MRLQSNQTRVFTAKPYHWVTLLAVVVLAMLALAPRTASAVPPGITFSRMTPVNGTTLFVARTAANNPLDTPTFQLKADLFLNNSMGTDREVTNVRFSYPGSGIANRTYNPVAWVDDDADPDTPNVAQNRVLAAFDESVVPIHDGLDRDLPTPLPATVQIDVFIDTDLVPLTLMFNLAFRENAVPLKAHFFPAKATDLDEGEYWYWGTRHSVDSGGAVTGINPSGGSQRYALDVGVVKWNGSEWSGLEDGGDGSENVDSRVWDKPLYSMGDGVIIQCYRGEPDEAPAGFDEIDFHFGFGNSLFIRYGDDLVSYGHMQQGTIPEALCPTPSSPGPGLWPDDNPQTGLNIPVTTGQLLGHVGNTGRSTGPHLHFQVEHIQDSGPNTVSGAPMQFLNVRALADDDNVNNLGEDPTLQPLHGMTLHRNTLILPNPCGLDLPAPGFQEVSRHGIPADCYQDVVNMIVSRGYKLVFVDGYNIGDETFFNATFGPGGGSWVARHGLTGDEYQALFDDLTEDGFRLQQIDSYLENGAVRYAALFEVRQGPNFAAFHGLSDTEFAETGDGLADDGYVPVNLSTVEVGGDLYWTGLYEQVNADGWTIASVPAEDYQDAFDDNDDAGRTLIYVHGYNIDGDPYITGIFVDPVGGNTAASHGLTSDEYQDAWDTNTGDGLYTRYTTGYDDGGEVFAAVWRSRPNTSITDGPPDPTNQTSATFEFEATNPFATFECKLDTGSFSYCASPKTLNGLSEGSHTFSVRAVDREGIRDLSPATTTWLVDITPPVVTCDPPDGVWHASDVSRHCTASDALSGLANAGDASFFLTTSVPIGTETANAFTNSRNVYDKAGNLTTAGPLGGNKVDKKAPVITITTPVDGAVYFINQPVASAFGCVDGGSDVFNCLGPVANGANIDTSSVGTKNFTVNSLDNVGNPSFKTVTYKVTYNICLLYDPTTPKQNLVSVTLNICDYFGVNLSSPAVSLLAVGITPAQPLSSVGNSNPGNLFNLVGDSYKFNLSLKGFPTGAYTLDFTATADPITHHAAVTAK